MASLIIRLIFIILPLILFNLLLQNEHIYRYIIQQNYHINNWYFPRENLTDWADTLIMGNSLASTGIRPDILENKLNHKQTIWSIAQPGSMVSTDYFNLQRILATCQKCPKAIIYIVSETSFIEDDFTHWSLYDNFERLYIDTHEENETLKKAARYDRQFEDIYNSLQLAKLFRPYLLRRQLTSILKKHIYGYFFHPLTIDPSQVIEGPTTGYYASHHILDRSNFSSYLFEVVYKNFEIGKANELFFDRFIATAKANNIRVIVVQLPLSPIYFEKAGKINDKFQNYISPLLERLHINAIDDRHLYNELNMFADVTHINADGAKDYSLHLAKEINKLGKTRPVVK